MPPKEKPTAIEKQILARLLVIEKQQRKIIRRSKVTFYLAVFKIALIITPIILGFIYLPPLFRSMTQSYTDLLTSVQGVTDPANEALSNIPVDQLKNILQLVQ